MNILLAPNAFKGSLKATECCQILAEELLSPEITTYSLPMCDGGDGTAEVIASYLNARPVSVITCDALGREKEGLYYITSDSAIIDLAEICGLKDLTSSEYDVMNANTAGLGFTLREIALQKNIKKIILGIGGSASIDGGLGALSEMGLTIFSTDNQYRNPLVNINDIDSGNLKCNFKNIDFTILCDVENVLIGEYGAAKIFGPQKGATPSQISFLDESLFKYSEILKSKTGVNVANLNHGGTAGGIAASFAALLDARLISGAEYCIRISHFQEKIQQADIVITGEGRIDNQSFYGKLPGTITSICKKYNKPIFAVAGIIESDMQDIFNQTFALTDYAGSSSASYLNPIPYLKTAAKDIKKEILYKYSSFL